KMSQNPKTGGGMDDVSRYLQAQGRLAGITNGINHKSYDITDRDTFKEYAIDTTAPMGFVKGKERIKKELFEAGLIGDPEKPLFFFVGRYDYDKGVDVLPALVEQAIKEGGQVVLMGNLVGGYCPAEIAALKRLASDPLYKNLLKVYTDRKVQDIHFKDS